VAEDGGVWGSGGMVVILQGLRDGETFLFATSFTANFTSSSGIRPESHVTAYHLTFRAVVWRVLDSVVNGN
jgi:hypothetical protein